MAHRSHATLLTLIVVAMLTSITPLEAAIPSAERDALIALYTDAGGASWNDSSGWLGPPGTECTWFGVACDPAETHVEVLFLDGNNLVGSLPAELQNLTELRTLWLSWNAIWGPLPEALGNLSMLQELVIAGNQLSGDIPASIGALTNLTYLDLWLNQLSGPIPSQLGNLGLLADLRLGDNALSGPIPATFGNLSSLMNLSLEYNQLSGSIPTELAGLTSLEWLHLGFNELTGTIPPALATIPGLCWLSLSDNRLEGPIPAEFGGFQSLQELYLNNNRLTGSIPAELGDIDTLVWLSLGSNRLDGALPPELGNLPTLVGLFLDDNLLSGPIPPQLGNLMSLSELHLARNRLSGPIPTQLADLASLQGLDLSHNCLSGPVPPEIGNLISLQGLQLTSNMISGAIPATITSLISLGDWSSSIDWNAVHSDDPAVMAFMDAKFGSGWRDSQTVPPQNLAVDFTTGISAGLSWDPIPYQWDAGGYDIMVAGAIGGPYEPLTRTLGKQAWSWPLFDLAPSTTYYVKLCAVTEPHPNNQNTVMSELTAPVTVTTTADPSTWFAATTGLSGNDCATPATPCPTVQEAIWLAAPGERVMVAPGTYHERITVDRIIQIVGDGAASTILDADGGGTVIWVDWGMHAHVSDLTLRNGTIHLGGGVYVAPNSMLELADAVVADSHAHDAGGGIFVDWQSGARLERVEMTGNTATIHGGAVYSSWGTHVDVSDSRIAGNTSPWGGGLFLTGSSSLERATIEANTADGYGGGGMATEGIAILTDSTVAGNEAAHGGGIANLGNGFMSVVNSTVSGNSGGGLFNDRWGRVELESCTVVDNVAPFAEHSGLMNWNELYLHNSIIAANTPFNCANPVTSRGYNLEDGTTCGLIAPGDLSDIEPLLGPLADNGGPTMTHALDPASPAIDAADPSDFPPFDQRGWERPLDGNADGLWLPDIGAVEYAGVVFFDSFESGDTSAWSSTTP